jgi:hypothetical protein
MFHEEIHNVPVKVTNGRVSINRPNSPDCELRVVQEMVLSWGIHFRSSWFFELHTPCKPLVGFLRVGVDSITLLYQDWVSLNASHRLVILVVSGKSISPLMPRIVVQPHFLKIIGWGL